MKPKTNQEIIDVQSLNSEQSNEQRLIENYKSALTQQMEHEDENDQHISESLDSGDNATLNPGTGRLIRICKCCCQPISKVQFKV